MTYNSDNEKVDQEADYYTLQFIDFFRKKKITENDVKQRLDICNNCDRLIKKVNICKECGCFMNFKTKFSRAFCPLNKWGKI